MHLEPAFDSHKLLEMRDSSKAEEGRGEGGMMTHC